MYRHSGNLLTPWNKYTAGFRTHYVKLGVLFCCWRNAEYAALKTSINMMNKNNQHFAISLAYVNLGFMSDAAVWITPFLKLTYITFERVLPMYKWLTDQEHKWYRNGPTLFDLCCLPSSREYVCLFLQQYLGWDYVAHCQLQCLQSVGNEAPAYEHTCNTINDINCHDDSTTNWI